MQSPFQKHRDILLHADYSAAQSLQQFVLSLYNSAATKFEADRLSNYDSHHLGIFVELATSYNRHTENDPAFMQLCRDMWSLRMQWGREHLERVEEHRQINPKAYDDGEQAWHEQMRWLDRQTEAYQAKGWIES